MKKLALSLVSLVLILVFVAGCASAPPQQTTQAVVPSIGCQSTTSQTQSNTSGQPQPDVQSTLLSSTNVQSGPSTSNNNEITSSGEGNFTLLISDEPNDIGDFEKLNVTINKIGFQNANEEWTEEEIDNATVDLVVLQGDNATDIWSANLAAGEYTKVFIYINNVEGTLKEAGDAVLKLPGGKLQISKPFTITEDEKVDFVYDITVIKTGSDKYILKPQIGASGADKPFKDIEGKKVKESKFQGTIVDNSTNIWDVQIGDEVKKVDVSNAEIEGEPAQDLNVMIKGIVDAEGVIIASKVEIEEAEEENTEEESIETAADVQEFTGTIESIKGKNWLVKIDDISKTVNVSQADIIGIAIVGASVKIKGSVQDEIIKAIEVEVVTATP